MSVIVEMPTALLSKAGVKNPKPYVYGFLVIVAVVGVIIATRQVKIFLGIMPKTVDKHTLEGGTTITKDDALSIASRLWANINGNLIVSFGSLMTDVPNPESLTKADKAMIYNAFGKHNNGFPFYTEGDLFFWLDRKIKFGVNEAKTYWGY